MQITLLAVYLAAILAAAAPAPDTECVAKGVRNGGFETGKLPPWKSSDSKGAEITITSPGDASKYAASLTALARAPGRDPFQVQLIQVFRLCPNQTYTLSFSYRPQVANQNTLRVNFNAVQVYEDENLATTRYTTISTKVIPRERVNFLNFQQFNFDSSRETSVFIDNVELVQS